MDTSKNYYESVMRDFFMYRRGRTLEQYCLDEGVDFKWLTKAQQQYGNLDEHNKKKKGLKSNPKRPSEMPGIIRLHYEDDTTAEEVSMPTENVAVVGGEPIQGSQQAQWAVSSLMVTTPAGDEIEIRGGKLSAVMDLLAKLAR